VLGIAMDWTFFFFSFSCPPSMSVLTTLLACVGLYLHVSALYLCSLPLLVSTQKLLSSFYFRNSPDDYQQAVYKFQAKEQCDINTAQGNMDAYFENPNDWYVLLIVLI
jgi:hypothetical protein